MLRPELAGDVNKVILIFLAISADNDYQFNVGILNGVGRVASARL